MESVASNGMTLRFIHNPTDEDIDTAIGQNGLALQYVSYDRRTYNRCITAVSNNGQALKHVPKNLQNYTLVKAAVSNHGWAIGHVRPDLVNYELCLIAVNNNPMSIRFIDNSAGLVSDIEFEQLKRVASGLNRYARM